MPTYQYRCKSCDHEFELIQKMSDDPISVCPECQGSVKRLIGTGAGIIFKGSGFYQTDYRSDSYKKAAESEKKTDSGDTAKKSETKKTAGSGTAASSD